MKLRPTMVIVLASAASVMTAASAQPSDKLDHTQLDRFRGLDANGDGYLTKKEVSRSPYAQIFDKADGNRDGKLSIEEWAEAEAMHDRQRVAGYVGDSALTAKVKTALFRDPSLKAMDVSVETDNGRVLLSGWVANDEQRKKAVDIASRVEGVKQVKDSMVVK